jgi:NAD(P)-dependent dehydrogenase (short-subunit alcohol dehydrogenase family)
MKLQGKTAIITGAVRGIGKETARLFAAEGADVVVNGLTAEAVGEACAEIEKTAKGMVLPFTGDISYKGPVDAMFDLAMETTGRVDVLVNNAGISIGKSFLEYTEEFWDDNLRNNLKSVYLNSQRAARIMVKQNGGAIINLSSIGATRSHRETVAYDTSKGAIDAMTKALAVELGPWNIRCNAISPAVILGHYVKKLPADVLERRDPSDFATPLLRQGEPIDVAYLAAD